ncbi:carboxylesterase family protein [Nonomuraea dietziae]|uniref:carboxylesterase family protein n=1 Tax=Nonomuraea dietziae TaxID=65515 RepID=UPI0034362CF2
MAAPVPVEPWDGTRDATTFGPRPPQPAVLPGMPEWSPADGLDCLTVNVWTPDPGGSGLPVMVWIYGGAYLTGAADMPEYDGARLAAEGVVVVSGWPAYDSLTATTHLFDVEPSDVSDPEAALRALWGERGIALLDQAAS